MVSYLYVLALVCFAVCVLADKDPSKAPPPPPLEEGKPETSTLDSELAIEKDCGEDNVCVPDLQVHAEPTKEKFTVGTADQTVVLNVTVRNRGEASYRTHYQVAIPRGFEYSGVENYETKHKVSCSPSVTNTNNTHDPYRVVCKIGNPLPANERARFGVWLTGTNVDASKEYVEVKMKVSSASEEASGREGDNEVVVRIPLEVKAQLSLVGRSNPEVVDCSVRNRTRGESASVDTEIGPIVSHLFQVTNRGSAIIGATLDIYWPSYSDNGKHLLYLIDMPFISDRSKAKCQVKQGHNVNPEGLKLSNVHKNFVEEDEFNDYSAAEDDYEEVRPSSGSYNNNRRRRKASPLVSLREQKKQLKEAVELAMQAGTGFEYRGKLNRAAVDCLSLNCTQITCDIGRLEDDDYVQVEIYSRLWLNTLIVDSVSPADTTSLAFAQITSLTHAPSIVPPAQVYAVKTDAHPTDNTNEQYQGLLARPIEQGLPWWLILLATVIALLVLALLILCCWRLGFFKRNRPPLEEVQRAGPTNGERYADSSARYTPATMYSPERHGAKV